jgi:hypothetical protein
MVCRDETKTPLIPSLGAALTGRWFGINQSFTLPSGAEH